MGQTGQKGEQVGMGIESVFICLTWTENWQLPGHESGHWRLTKAWLNIEVIKKFNNGHGAFSNKLIHYLHHKLGPSLWCQTSQFTIQSVSSSIFSDEGPDHHAFFITSINTRHFRAMIFEIVSSYSWVKQEFAVGRTSSWNELFLVQLSCKPCLWACTWGDVTWDSF